MFWEKCLLQTAQGGWQGRAEDSQDGPSEETGSKEEGKGGARGGTGGLETDPDRPTRVGRNETSKKEDTFQEMVGEGGQGL